MFPSLTVSHGNHRTALHLFDRCFCPNKQSLRSWTDSHIQGWCFCSCIFFCLSPVLLQLRTLLGSLWISQLCWRESPSASMPPALSVFVSSRYRPWKNGRQKNRIRTRNSLPAWGSMTFGPQRDCYSSARWKKSTAFYLKDWICKTNVYFTSAFQPMAFRVIYQMWQKHSLNRDYNKAASSVIQWDERHRWPFL